MISTSDLSPLPAIEWLRQRMQQMAALDAVLGIEYDAPQFEFHPKWGRDEQVGAIKNGSGDELFAHFTLAGCFIKGFAHESPMSPYRSDPPALWPGLLDSVPRDFQTSLTEPAFDIPATTFVIWRLNDDKAWAKSDIDHQGFDDGSADLLAPFSYSAEEFADWLADNYEVDIDESIVASVFAHHALTDEQLARLNPSQKVKVLQQAVSETGFPIAPPN